MGALSSECVGQSRGVRWENMRRFQATRPVILSLFLTAIVAVILITGWQLRPLVREYCVRQGVLAHETQSWWPESWKQEIKVRKKLVDPVTLEFVETPLSDVLDFLRDYTGVEIILEKDALKKLGFDDGIPASIHVQRVTLRSSLRLLLDQVQLSYLIENGSLVITSRRDAQARVTSATSPATPRIGLESLRSESQQNRCEAAFAAAYDRPRAEVAVPQLIAALQDNSRDVRIDAAFALGEIGHEAASAAPVLADFLEGDDNTLRNSAIVALHNMGRSAVDKALKKIDDPTESVATRYRDGLATETIQKVVRRAIDKLKNEDAGARLGAVATLSTFHPHAKPAVANLNEALDDTDGRVRLAAAKALWKIEGAAPQALPKLIEVLKGDVSDVDPQTGYHTQTRCEILAFLSQTGQERVLDVQTLIDLLNDRDSGVRKEIAKLLGKFGSRATDAVLALTKVLDQPQADVRLEAATALLRIGPANDRIVEELVDLLHDNDEYVHVPALELLGQCGWDARMAVPELESIIKNRKNDRWGVRKAADRALQRISEAIRQDEIRRKAQEQP